MNEPSQQSNLPVAVPGNRWRVLLIVGFSAMLNNCICFAHSPYGKQARKYFGSQQAIAELVQAYFVTYCLCAFAVSSLISSLGMRGSLCAGAALQSAGAVIKVLGRTSLPVVLLGQAVCGGAQGFFTNSPAEVSFWWFPDGERLLATSIGVNANALGVAVAYIRETWMSMYTAMLLDAGGCVLGLALCVAFIPDPVGRATMLPTLSTLWEDQVDILVRFRAAIRPTGVAVAKYSPGRLREGLLGARPLTMTNWALWSMVRVAWHVRVYWFQLPVFSVSETVLNLFSSDMGTFLEARGVASRYVGALGAGFVVTNLLGSIVVCSISHSGSMKAALTLCLAASTAIALFMTWPTLHLRGVLPVSIIGFFFHANLVDDPKLLAVLVLVLGFFVGPIQSLSIEMAVEAAFPFLSETACTTILQVCGNLLSAVLTPTFHRIEATVWGARSVVGILLLGLLCSTMFDENYRRHRAERSLRRFSGLAVQ